MMSSEESDPDALVFDIKSQEDLETIASTLDIKYKVEDNLSGGRALFSASITLTNRCDITLGHNANGKQWAIYFSHLRMVEPTYLPAEESVDLEYAGVRFSHLNGCIFKFSPLKNFSALKKDDTVQIKFNGQHYSASRSDILPNWYIYVEGLEPRILKCTEGESLDFVSDFVSPKQYKRYDYTLASGKRRYDIYQPFSTEVRFSRYPSKEENPNLKQVIPTPKIFQCQGEGTVDILSGDWCIVPLDDDFSKVAKYLSEKTNILVLENSGNNPCVVDRSKVIKLSKMEPSCDMSSVKREAYNVLVDDSKNEVQISSFHPSGMFYGIQTLLSLMAPSSGKSRGSIPACSIQDEPRYSYRGMHADISRNFQGVEVIKRLLDAMAMYKLNVFHFHLTDDEGWRLQIPGLGELTEIGAKRGHDPKEETCLLSLLGSGPFPTGLGCGYYTTDDYRDILRYANARHIEVIPEIDMPGHSHAAVTAMRVRYDRLMQKNKKEEAEQYLLSDPSEGMSRAFSVQMLTENSMNPGLESTYSFIEKVISELIELHKDVQPLRVFHLGGDEVPVEAWDNSPACLALKESGKIKCLDELMEYFVTRVGVLAHKYGLELGAWQDGIVEKHSGPYKRSKFPNSKVLVHFWRNVWESGQAFDAFKLANNGFEVVLAPGTHLYFDHPHEPDPEERGLYWACRYVDAHKVFKFAPDNLMSNADVKLTGEKITKSDLNALKNSEDYTELKKPQNIIGLQGQIWTELVRTPQQFHEMIFPRLLVLGERAWHKAPWEDLEADERKPLEEEEWSIFSHTLGMKELLRLEEAEIPFHIPPPGASGDEKIQTTQVMITGTFFHAKSQEQAIIFRLELDTPNWGHTFTIDSRLTGDGQLELRSCYPGLPLSFSVDKGETWNTYTKPEDVTAHDEVFARASSHQGRYHSRSVKVQVNTFTDSDEPCS